MEKLIHSAASLDKKQYDLLVKDGSIAAMEPAGSLTVAPDAEVLDAQGYMLLPPLVDGHAHLDKTLLGMKWWENTLGPLLRDRINNERMLRKSVGLDPFVQAGRLIQRCISMGTLAMRSHVDIDTVNGLSGLEGVLAAKEKYRDLFHTEIVAFPQSGLVSAPGTVELMESAMRMGADIVGGLDPAGIDRDPKGSVDAIFALAEKFGKPIDIHLHEPGELGAFTMELIVEHTLASGMQGKVTLSHALCLGSPDAGRVASLVEKLAEADIQITTGGQPYVETLPSVKQLTAAGVNICGGNDNIRDMWTPFGSGDMLERAQFIAMRNFFRRDADLELALKVCTENSAKLLGLQEYGVAPGRSADFVLVRGETAAECVAAHPADRMVFRAGKLVAKDLTFLG